MWEAPGQDEEAELDSEIGLLRRIAERDEDIDDLIYGSDDDASLFDNSLPDLPTSPGMQDTGQQQLLEENIQTLSPPRRPPIHDPETGEEMKIPEMTDEEFNESFGEHMQKAGQGVQTAERGAEAIAALGESAGTGAALVAGTGKVLKVIFEAEDNDLDQLDTKHTEKTDQAAYHSQNVTQTTTQATQATTQATTQASQAAASQAAASQAAASQAAAAITP